MTLTTITISSNTYQAYASASEADEELAVDLQRMDGWDGLSDTEKGRYLVAATRRLDALNWAGARASESQALQWPRTGMNPTPDADIPSELEKATILLAGDLAVDTSGESAADIDAAEIQSHRQGPVSTTYFSRRRDMSVRSVAIPGRTALECIGQWLEAAEVVAPESFGTDGVSEFVPLDRYGRTEGIG